MPLPCLRVKPGTTFTTIAPGGFRLLAALDAATTVLGRDLTITAGTNDHTSGKHPIGEAYDVRAADLPDDVCVALIQFLRARVGSAFTVFYETRALTPTMSAALKSLTLVSPGASAPHIHLQVKKGTVWPPLVE